ncbi:CBS domain-containing protein [Fictibacillus sp. KU28468]|uniref:CBS domain-containing protein n=1 Tax=Fictibacillus sp. KU28468 TaxID=2991053 RepID=UPI00223E4B5F|nr:CBS domain-containing protein [Fictibacillus sp. KU28468]UZJ77287.1 CBS domain-containing protein [Fictibacillus sp. KU28468]
MKTISDIMTTNVDSCSPQDSIYEIAVKMKQDDVGVIPVCEGKKLLGVITDRDIVIRAVAEKKQGSTKVTDVMSSELITGSPDMNIEEASDLMSKDQIRRLPIVENSNLVGIVSLGDIAVHKETDSKAGAALSEISEQRDQLQ